MTTTLLASVSLSVPKRNNSCSSCLGNEVFSNMKLHCLIDLLKLQAFFPHQECVTQVIKSESVYLFEITDDLFSIKILIFSLCFIRLLPCISTIA